MASKQQKPKARGKVPAPVLRWCGVAADSGYYPLEGKVHEHKWSVNAKYVIRVRIVPIQPRRAARKGRR